MDPIAWELAESEWIDSELSESNLMTFDGGSNYYWSHEIERCLDESDAKSGGHAGGKSFARPRSVGYAAPRPAFDSATLSKPHAPGRWSQLEVLGASGFHTVEDLRLEPIHVSDEGQRFFRLSAGGFSRVALSPDIIHSHCSSPLSETHLGEVSTAGQRTAATRSQLVKRKTGIEIKEHAFRQDVMAVQ
jgi:hypothetical protein